MPREQIPHDASPFALVDADIEAAAFAQASGSPETADRLVAEGDAALSAVTAELGDISNGIDLDRITSIAGSGGEKMQKLVELHSNLTGARRAQLQHKALAHMDGWRERLLAEPEDTPEGRAAESYAAMAARHGATLVRAPALSDLVAEAQDGTIDVAVTGQQVRRIAVDVGADIYGTLFQRGAAGIAPDDRRMDRIGTATPLPRLDVLDAFGTPIPTTQAAIKFLRETVTSDASVEVAEGAKEAEYQISFADVMAAVQTIRGDIPVTEEQLADVPQARSILDGRLLRRLRARLARQAVVGDGQGANLSGVIVAAGATQAGAATAADGPSDPIGDVRKGIAQLENLEDFEPTGVLLHPEVWATAQLTKANGMYIFGSPGLQVSNVLWGIPVYPTAAVATGKANNGDWGVVGDFMEADIYLRADALVEAGWIADDFAKFQTRLRASVRATIAVYSQRAFVKLRAAI